MKLSYLAVDEKDKQVATGEFEGTWIDLQQMVGALKLLLHPRSPTVKITFEVMFSIEDQVATSLARRNGES